MPLPAPDRSRPGARARGVAEAIVGGFYVRTGPARGRSASSRAAASPAPRSPSTRRGTACGRACTSTSGRACARPPRRAPAGAARRPAPGRPAARPRRRASSPRRGREGFSRGRPPVRLRHHVRPLSAGRARPSPTTRCSPSPATAAPAPTPACRWSSWPSAGRARRREAINLDGGGSTSLVCAGGCATAPVRSTASRSRAAGRSPRRSCSRRAEPVDPFSGRDPRSDAGRSPVPRVVIGLMFFPRGGSAHVTRALARALPKHGWDVTVVSGSLPAGAATRARFFAGLDVRRGLHRAIGRRPLAHDAPMHPSFEDRPDAPDRVFAKVDDAGYERQVDAWARRAGASRGGRGGRPAPPPPHADARGRSARRARRARRDARPRHRAADARGDRAGPPDGWDARRAPGPRACAAGPRVGPADRPRRAQERARRASCSASRRSAAPSSPTASIPRASTPRAVDRLALWRHGSSTTPAAGGRAASREAWPTSRPTSWPEDATGAALRRPLHGGQAHRRFSCARSRGRGNGFAGARRSSWSAATPASGRASTRRRRSRVGLRARRLRRRLARPRRAARLPRRRRRARPPLGARAVRPGARGGDGVRAAGDRGRPPRARPDRRRRGHGMARRARRRGGAGRWR